MSDQYDSLRHRLEIYERNLRIIEVQAAQFNGEILAPLHIVNSIAEQRKNIQRIEAEIRKKPTSTQAELGVTQDLDKIEARMGELEELIQELKVSQTPSPNHFVSHSPQSGAGRSLRVFLCHASEDKADVRRLYVRLKKDGIEPWLDEKSLVAGQVWKREIEKAVRDTDIFLVCLSQKSTTKEGFVKHEIQYALDVADKQPEGAIFIIPVKLEECEIPQGLANLHWVSLFRENGYENLFRALKARAESLGIFLAIQVIPANSRSRRSYWSLLSAPWRNWGDHPVVVIISLVVTLITIVSFITGGKQLSDFLSSSNTVPTSTLALMGNTSTSTTVAAEHTSIAIPTTNKEYRLPIYGFGEYTKEWGEEGNVPTPVAKKRVETSIQNQGKTFLWDMDTSIMDTSQEYWRLFKGPWISDFELQIEVLKKGKANYGVSFHSDGSIKYCQFDVNEDKRTAGFSCYDQVKFYNQANADISKIKLEESNVLKVRCVGDNVQLYINNEPVRFTTEGRSSSFFDLTVTDPTSGYIGLVAFPSEEGKSSVEFTNFILKEP